MVETELHDDSTIAEGVDTFADVAPMDSGLEAVLSTLTEGDFVAQGGQAQVHRVRKGDVDVAARSVSFREDDDQIKRLQREARVLRGLKHPNIVGYRGYEVNPVKRRWGTDVEYTFYMDFIHGPTLRDILEPGKDHRELSGSETDAIFAQVGSALSYCHDRGILHRDIKPSNVKLMEGDVVKVIDFGLVKKEGESTMTGSEGRFLGSYKYAAPEVREGKKAEAASDWYSTAVMTVELLLSQPYTKVVDPADVRSKLGKITTLPSRLRESLELLLEEDVSVRMKNVERVKGLYGLGKVVDENVVARELMAGSIDDVVKLDEVKEVVWKSDKILIGLNSILGASAGALVVSVGEVIMGYVNEYDVLKSLTVAEVTGMIAGAAIGGTANYLIQKYGSIRKGIKQLRERYDLYDVPPFLAGRGQDSLIEQGKDKYRAWKKARLLKKSPASLSSMLEKICEGETISERQLRNTILPALEHRDNNVKAAAVKALVKYDLEKREYSQLVEQALPLLYEVKDPYAKVEALIYLTAPNATAEEREKYIPQLKGVPEPAVYDIVTRFNSPFPVAHVYSILLNREKATARTPVDSLEDKVGENLEYKANQKKEAVSIWKQKIDRKESAIITGISSAGISVVGLGIGIGVSDSFNSSNVLESLIASFLGGGTLGYLVGNYYDSVKAKVEGLWNNRKKKRENSLEEKIGETRSEQPVIINASVAETPTTGVSGALESKVSKPSAGQIAEYDNEIFDKKNSKMRQGAYLGFGAGSLLLMPLEKFIDHKTNNDLLLALGCGGMLLGTVMGIGIGYLYHKYIQVPKLRKKYGLEEKVGESDAEKLVADLSDEDKEDKKGLVQRVTERYNAWREEKGREWVEKNVGDYNLNKRTGNDTKYLMSSKRIKRMILPALHSGDHQVQKMALDVILLNDIGRGEFRGEVGRVFPKMRSILDSSEYCFALTYLSTSSSPENRENAIKEYLLPALTHRNSDVQKHALGLLTTLEPEAEVKYKAEIATARESMSKDNDDWSDDPWHQVNPVKYPGGHFGRF